MSADLSRRAFLAAVSALALAPRVRAQLAPPSAARGLPHRALGGLPTPVTRIELAGRPLWVKRDDQAGEGYGGSKARKLERFLADALARGHDRVLTFGGAGSNHALATAHHARRLGLGCVLMLLPEPPSEHVRAHLVRAQGLGAALHAGRRGDLANVGAALARIGESARRLYVIPQGGTSALGNVGTVDAGFELAAQIANAQLPRPARIYVAAGTTGTAAGLFVGLRAAGLASELVAVRTSSRASVSPARLRREIESTVALLRSTDPAFPRIEADGGLRIDDRVAGPGYAVPSAEGARATLVAREQGLVLDSTYSAKAFAALLRDAPRAGDVLFWSTYDPRTLTTGASAADVPPAFRGYWRSR